MGGGKKCKRIRQRWRPNITLNLKTTEKENRITGNMETRVSKTSDNEQERKRKEMSWADQVDLVYPLVSECEFRTQTEERQDMVDGILSC